MTHKYVKFNRNYHKFLGQEDILAGSCKEWMLAQYPKVAWWHTANEGKRTPFEQYKNAILGVVAGVSDFISPEPRRSYNGLVIEMKVVYANGTKNSLTKDQKEFLADMRRCNMVTAVIYNLDQFQELINWYFSNYPPNSEQHPKTIILQ